MNIYFCLNLKGASGQSRIPEDKKIQSQPGPQQNNPAQKKSGGRQEVPLDVLDFDELAVQEEVENWLMRVSFFHAILINLNLQKNF